MMTMVVGDNDDNGGVGDGDGGSAVGYRCAVGISPKMSRPNNGQAREVDRVV